MVRALAAVTLALGLAALGGGQAAAWTPPRVGPACHGLRHAGPPVIRIAGNFLGGRRVGHGFLRQSVVDYKSFQNCFGTLQACETWLAHHALRFPLRPGFATCTPVRLR